jgi:hypothetical protein
VTKKPLLASIALTAALVGGGIAGFLLGVPGVSQAQTTTVPADPPTTTAPAPDATPPARGHRDGKDCPDKAGQADDGTTDAPASGTSTVFGYDGARSM